MRNNTVSSNFFMFLLLILFINLISECSTYAQRTVNDRIRGSIYIEPYGSSYSNYGLFIGGERSEAFRLMSDPAIKGIHTTIQHLEPSTTSVLDRRTGFPSEEFDAYEATEISNGRDGLWCHAYYQNESRPLIFLWHIGEGDYNSVALNLRDDRYIKFYLNSYVRSLLNPAGLNNWTLGLDNGIFRQNMYGVYDDSDNFIYPVTWESEFPQSTREWTESANYLFRRVKELAPDIRVIVNEASNDRESDFEFIFGSVVDGIMYEGWLGDSTDSSAIQRQTNWIKMKRMFNIFRDKILLYQINVPADADASDIRTAVIRFLICTGPNGFMGLRSLSTYAVPDPTTYLPVYDKIGDPVGDPINEQESGMGEGYMLHSRQTEGGWIFYNRTGSSETVTLPSGTWYDPDGNVVTSLNLNDLEGSFVTSADGGRVAKPRINPGIGETLMTGPVDITIECTTSGASIRYTTDGSEPDTGSTLYTAPFSRSSTSTIKAKAFKDGLLDSFTNSKKYNLTATDPSVEFLLASDYGDENLETHYPVIKLNRPSGETVTVQYSVTGGTATVLDDYMLEGKVIVDNSSPDCTFVGVWGVHNAIAGWEGVAKWSTTTNSTAEFRPYIPAAGNYKVYAWWGNRSSFTYACDSSADYKIFYSSGDDSVTVDQDQDAEQWTYLGEYHFDVGTDGYVILTHDGPDTGGRTVADAVCFYRVTEDSSYTTGTVTFEPGQQYAAIPLTLVNDATTESNETIVFTLSVPTNASLGTQTTHTFTIREPSVSRPYKAPVVSVTTPADNGTVSGTINITATAHDPDIGTSNGDGIASVDFLIRRGSMTIATATDSQSAYNWSLDTTTLVNGDYTLRVTVNSTSAAGGTSMAKEINFTVNNTVANLNAQYFFEGDAYDETSNANDGTCYNGAGYSTASYEGGESLLLDGVNDYVGIPNSSSVDLTKNYTLSAWIRPSAITGTHSIISKADSTYERQFQFTVTLASGIYKLMLTTVRGSATYVSGGNLSLNRWHHVAATVDSSMNIKLYVDGEQVASGTASAEPYQSSAQVNIGRMNLGAYYFNGRIDDTRIYSRVLSSTEITSIAAR